MKCRPVYNIQRCAALKTGVILVQYMPRPESVCGVNFDQMFFYSDRVETDVRDFHFLLLFAHDILHFSRSRAGFRLSFFGAYTVENTVPRNVTDYSLRKYIPLFRTWSLTSGRGPFWDHGSTRRTYMAIARRIDRDTNIFRSLIENIVRNREFLDHILGSRAFLDGSRPISRAS